MQSVHSNLCAQGKAEIAIVIIVIVIVGLFS